MFELAMPLCILTIFSIYLAAGFAPFLLLISTIRSIISCVRSVLEYIFAAFVLVLGLLTSFILIILFCQFMQTLLGRIPPGHFIFRYLEKRAKAQLRALHQEEKKTAALIRQHLKAIDQWDEANANLMIEIRAAEAMIVKRVWNWVVVPEREPRSKTAGSTYFVHGPCSLRPLEAPEPSTWSLVRWWRDEDDRRVWAAKRKATHQQGVLSDKRAVLARLEKEHEDLATKRDAAVRKRDALQWGPCRPKRTTDSWAERQLGFMSRSLVAHQPAPVQRQTTCFRRVVDLTNERCHYCEFCTKGGHNWRHHHESFATADAAPVVQPCPSAVARLRTRPAFVSAGAAGAPSFFDPDWTPAPYALPVPAPLLSAALSAPPPPPPPPPAAPLFTAPPAAALAPAQATTSLFSVQTPAPEKVSAPAMDPFLSAPKAAPAPAAESSAPAPVATSAADTAAAPIVKIAPAAPKGKGPPRALQIVWPGQGPAAAPVPLSEPAAAAAAAAAPIIKIAPAAPRGKGPPKALQIVWPGQGPAAAAAPSAPGPATGGSLMSRSSFGAAPVSDEQAAADALVKEEARARAVEKKEKAKANKRLKQMSASQEEKKDYRFG